MTSEVWGMRDVATFLDVAYESVRKYRHQRKLPEPDVMIGSSPGWHPDTIRQWNEDRPGHGWRRGKGADVSDS